MTAGAVVSRVTVTAGGSAPAQAVEGLDRDRVGALVEARRAAPGARRQRGRHAVHLHPVEVGVARRCRCTVSVAAGTTVPAAGSVIASAGGWVSRTSVRVAWARVAGGVARLGGDRVRAPRPGARRRARKVEPVRLAAVPAHGDRRRGADRSAVPTTSTEASLGWSEPAAGWSMETDGGVASRTMRWESCARCCPRRRWRPGSRRCVSPSERANGPAVKSRAREVGRRAVHRHRRGAGDLAPGG